MPPPSSPAAPRRLDPLMPHSSMEPQATDAAAAADPSISRGTEGTPAPSAVSAPEDSPPRGDGSDDDFVLDSGAVVHSTARGDLLSDPRHPDEATVVRTRVGAELPVAAVGCVRLPRFVVPQVHHASALKNGSTTVISVRQLSRRGLAVTFGADSCSVKDLSNGALVGEGRLNEEDGLYHLLYLRVPQS